MNKFLNIKENRVKTTLRILSVVERAIDKWFTEHPNKTPFLHMTLVDYDHMKGRGHSSTKNQTLNTWPIIKKSKKTINDHGWTDGGRGRDRVNRSEKPSVIIPFSKVLDEIKDVEIAKDQIPYSKGEVFEVKRTINIEDTYWIDCPLFYYDIVIENDPRSLAMVKKEKFGLTFENMLTIPSLRPVIDSLKTGDLLITERDFIFEFTTGTIQQEAFFDDVCGSFRLMIEGMGDCKTEIKQDKPPMIDCGIQAVTEERLCDSCMRRSVFFSTLDQMTLNHEISKQKSEVATELLYFKFQVESLMTVNRQLNHEISVLSRRKETDYQRLTIVQHEEIEMLRAMVSDYESKIKSFKCMGLMMDEAVKTSLENIINEPGRHEKTRSSFNRKHFRKK